MNDKAPSGRELSPKVTEGECDCISNKARVSYAGSFRLLLRKIHLPLVGRHRNGEDIWYISTS